MPVCVFAAAAFIHTVYTLGSVGGGGCATRMRVRAILLVLAGRYVRVNIMCTRVYRAHRLSTGPVCIHIAATFVYSAAVIVYTRGVVVRTIW